MITLRGAAEQVSCVRPWLRRVIVKITLRGAAAGIMRQALAAACYCNDYTPRCSRVGIMRQALAEACYCNDYAPIGAAEQVS